MGPTIATVPCCWSVDDVRNPNLPPWERVLDEAATAGYDGLELVPYGYMPLDVDIMGPALRKRGLTIVTGTIFDDLMARANRDSLLRQTDEICALLSRPPRETPFSGSGACETGHVRSRDRQRAARLRRRHDENGRSCDWGSHQIAGHSRPAENR